MKKYETVTSGNISASFEVNLVINNTVHVHSLVVFQSYQDEIILLHIIAKGCTEVELNSLFEKLERLGKFSGRFFELLLSLFRMHSAQHILKISPHCTALTDIL